jgi:type III secretion system chaperone SycN
MTDWIAETVRAYGANIGIENLALDADDGIELELDSGECMGIQRLPDTPDDDMLVYWGRRLNFDPAAQLERALNMVNGRLGLPWPAQTAIRDDMLIMTMRLPASSFELPALEEAINQLEGMQVEAAG